MGLTTQYKDNQIANNRIFFDINKSENKILTESSKKTEQKNY